MEESADIPLFRIEQAVRWSEMDALGHVNNAVYFRWFEQVRIGWYESLGYPPLATVSPPAPTPVPPVDERPGSVGSGSVDEGSIVPGSPVPGSMVVVDNHAEYLQPVIYPSELSIRMAGHTPGRSSFVSTYTIHVGERLTTRGRAKIVWIDPATGRSMPLPDRVRGLVGGTAHV